MTMSATYEAEARYLGADAAMAAVSWLEMSEGDATSILGDVDPMVLDNYEPPNLSGEWADDPTPASLANDVLGLRWTPDDVGQANHADVENIIAEAWEQGRDEVWWNALLAHALRTLGRSDDALKAGQRLESVVTEMRKAAGR